MVSLYKLPLLSCSSCWIPRGCKLFPCIEIFLPWYLEFKIDDPQAVMSIFNN